MFDVREHNKGQVQWGGCMNTDMYGCTSVSLYIQAVANEMQGIGGKIIIL